ncbi:MAG TPA: alpha/beta hydrolase [Thermodesulfobacteriota bacterium]|nr:alpha/beta hydrolase [Thermodesulfobacteriota bacterium]
MIQRQRKLISINSKDGFLIHSLLVTSVYEKPEDLYETPIVIMVHGVLGHFLARGTPRQLPLLLNERGINSFSINTRMAHLGQIFGSAIFDTAEYDIEAAVEFLKKEGFSKIFILGFSLGANLTAFYAANKPEPEVKGLILEGCAYSLPDSQKKRWDKWQSIPSYDEVYEKARELLGPDPLTSHRDEIFLVNRAWGDTFSPFHNEIYTYKTWWFMRSPEAHHAKTYSVIPRVKVPVLFLQGVNDDILEEREARELARLAAEAGNASVEVRYIENAQHDCMENPDAASDSIAGWIEAMAGKRGQGKNP